MHLVFDREFSNCTTSRRNIMAFDDGTAINDGVESKKMLSEDLLKILVCPACRAPLTLKEDGQSLKCASCHRVYRIQDDIPVLRIDQATIEAP